MPNAKPHDATNPKRNLMPASATKDKIIGYTGNLDGHLSGLVRDPQPDARPTVYFTVGHFTQAHSKDWNVGWESHAGWECRFFGNIEESKLKHLHFHDPPTKKVITNPTEHRQALNGSGKNRFQGWMADDISNWKLGLLGDETSNHRI